MMVNEIIKSIGAALGSEFDDCEIFAEELKQGLKEPCFFIQCLNPSHNLFLGKRYFHKNQFCIQYFPVSVLSAREECHAVACKMESCLEWIELTGHPVMGSNMHYEIIDSVLSFFINYNLFCRKISGEDNGMADLEIKGVKIKE